MRNAFTPPLNVPHSLSVSTETQDNLLIVRHCKITKQITVFQYIIHSTYIPILKRRMGYRGKILDQSKPETQQGKRLVSGTLMGVDGSAPLALLPAPLSPCKQLSWTDVAQFWHLLLSRDLHCNLSFLFTLHSNGLHGVLPSQGFQAGTPLPHAACAQQLSETTQGKKRTPPLLNPSCL